MPGQNLQKKDDFQEQLYSEAGIIQDLVDIEPEAGAQNVKARAAGKLKSLDVIENTEFDDLGTSGTLEGTELFITESDILEQNVFTPERAREIALEAGVYIAEEDTDVIEGDITQEEALPLFARVSDETNAREEINDNDHYDLTNPGDNKNHKLYGDEMDITGVADDVRVDFRFKSEGEFRAILKSDWNELKNIEVESGDAAKVTLKNFVHTDVTLGGDGDSNVNIKGVKRGFIETGDGDDKINIRAETNGSGWSNKFEIKSGAGNDDMKIKGDGGYTDMTVMAGDGDDNIKLYGDYGAGIVQGGSGDDALKGGTGGDVAVFSGDLDEYVITQRGNKYIIEDTVDGRDGTDIVRGFEGALFGADGLDIADILEENSDLDDLLAEFTAAAAPPSPGELSGAMEGFALFTMEDLLQAQADAGVV